MHSRQTEHYELPLYNGTDIINPLTDFNNANETIDEAIYNSNVRSQSAYEKAEEAEQSAASYDSRITEALTNSESAISGVNNIETMIADFFDPLKQGGYKKYDIVIYDGKLYEFTDNHVGAWDSADVKNTTIAEYLIHIMQEV